VELIKTDPFVAGSHMTFVVRFTVGQHGLRAGGQLRVGLPNTGWQRPTVPLPRFWDETYRGRERRYTPFDPINTTCALQTATEGAIFAEMVERMLVPDADPAFANWRFWVLATVEGADLAPGDRIEITYGDTRYGAPGLLIQSFPDKGLNISAYVDVTGDRHFVSVAGSPMFLDVVAGPAERVNVVIPSVLEGTAAPTLRVAATDHCHGRPTTQGPSLRIAGTTEAIPPLSERRPAEVRLTPSQARDGVTVVDAAGNVWGRSNRAVEAPPDGLRLFWGDLHGQSQYHVMGAVGAQEFDWRQEGWTRGLSSGTPEECFAFARDVALLDFAAITDQGGSQSSGWVETQEQSNRFNRAGGFVTLRAYEAGSDVGHRNVYYRGDEIDPPFDPADFSDHPRELYRLYGGRRDVLMIPHHVKVFTDWQYHDPMLEPLMEVYSAWGQSEHPGLDLWDKGQTPGAGAWEAFRRGYRLGMIASSDNHVGMPGRSYPGDRHAHTQFKGGLCAVWAPELTRQAIFDALRARRCYGTTGARIVVWLSLDGRPMGAELRDWPTERPRTLDVQVTGTDSIDRVEVVRNLKVALTHKGSSDRESFAWADDSMLGAGACYYLRVYQTDGERAWSSPIWVDPVQRAGRT
jgi:hypothetical protein